LAARVASLDAGGEANSGGGLVRKSHKRDSDHDFGSGLAWENESEESNMFRGLE
jgi:hypothetical protein